MIQLCGLTVKTSRTGRKYMSGELGDGARLLVFRNTFKRRKSDPDYVVCIAPKNDTDDALHQAIERAARGEKR